VRIALVPLYVGYYEKVVPGIDAAKAALIEKARVAIGEHYPVTVFDRVRDADGARVARERLLEGGFDCLIVLPLVATFSELSDELVQGWAKPLLLLSTLAGSRIPAALSMVMAVAESQSFGAQAIANGWMRQGVRFQALHVQLDSEAGVSALRQWLAVHDAVVRMPNLRIGRFGVPFEGMTDISLPADEFHRHTGATVVSIPMSRVHATMEAIPAAKLREFEANLRKQFTWGAFSSVEKEYSLRAALAILQLVEEEKLDCAAFNSHGPDGLQNPKLGLMAALGLTLATSNGCPVSEVGDLCTAFALWLGRRLGGACYYTELDSAYMPKRVWLLLNSGEFDLNWLRPGSRPRLVRNTNFAGVNGRGASVCAPLREGPATILNFTPTPCGARPYRIQFCEGRILKRWHSGLGVGTAEFELPGDARRTYELWLNAGPVHHSATSPGHLGPAISLFCEAMGWDVLQIPDGGEKATRVQRLL
jgi:L-arabinose isomerase